MVAGRAAYMVWRKLTYRYKEPPWSRLTPSAREMWCEIARHILLASQEGD